MNEPRHLIDISQPINRTTACPPGDTPFAYSLDASSGHYTVSAFTMSPHIGTHTDAPAHVEKNSALVGGLPLSPFIGPCLVLDLCPFSREIHVSDIEKKLLDVPRILFRTRLDVSEEGNASLSPEVIHFLHKKGVKLIGIDTQSVDPVDSKTLKVHHTLISCCMMWLENLDLSQAKEGVYFLSALPLKFMELEASPVRAVLLS